VREIRRPKEGVKATRTLALFQWLDVRAPSVAEGLQRRCMVIARNAELMGLGIDEDTGIIIRGHLDEVVGRGSATFVDGRGVRFRNADQCMDGLPLTLSYYLRVGIVGAGYTFNLRERGLETPPRSPHRHRGAAGDGAVG